jgi:hypothetical protein
MLRTRAITLLPTDGHEGRPKKNGRQACAADFLVQEQAPWCGRHSDPAGMLREIASNRSWAILHVPGSFPFLKLSH